MKPERGHFDLCETAEHDNITIHGTDAYHPRTGVLERGFSFSVIGTQIFIADDPRTTTSS